MRTYSQFIGFRCEPTLVQAVEKEFPNLSFSEIVRMALRRLLEDPDMKKAA